MAHETLGLSGRRHRRTAGLASGFSARLLSTPRPEAAGKGPDDPSGAGQDSGPRRAEAGSEPPARFGMRQSITPQRHAVCGGRPFPCFTGGSGGAAPKNEGGRR